MFHIGQKVICIKTHSNGVTQEGKIYEIHGIKECPYCKTIGLHLGIFVPAEITYTACNCGGRTYGKFWWQDSRRFRPVDEQFVDQVLENALEEEKVLVNH